MRIKQSLCYPMFRPKDMSLDDLFNIGAEIGYAAVEFWHRENEDDYEAVIETAKRHGLAVASMSGHQSLPDGLNKRSNHDRIEAELRESIDIAAKHGIRVAEALLLHQRLDRVVFRGAPRQYVQ